MIRRTRAGLVDPEKVMGLRRRFSPREESYRLCPFYQRQLINEEVIIFDELAEWGSDS